MSLPFPVMKSLSIKIMIETGFFFFLMLNLFLNGFNIKIRFLWYYRPLDYFKVLSRSWNSSNRWKISISKTIYGWCNKFLFYEYIYCLVLFSHNFFKWSGTSPAKKIRISFFTSSFSSSSQFPVTKFLRHCRYLF